MVQLSTPTIKLYTFYHFNHSVLRCSWMLPVFFPASYPAYYDLCWLLIISFVVLCSIIGCRFDILLYLCQLIIRSLRVSIPAFHSCSLCIYVVQFHTVSGFCLFSNITHCAPPCMQFLFVGSNVCRQLPSDSTSRWTPLLLADDTYCNAHSGLTPYSWYACLTH